MPPAVAPNAGKPVVAAPFPARARVASSTRPSALPAAGPRPFRSSRARIAPSIAAIASRSSAPSARHAAVMAAAGVAAEAVAEIDATAVAEAIGIAGKQNAEGRRRPSLFFLQWDVWRADARFFFCSRGRCVILLTT